MTKPYLPNATELDQTGNARFARALETLALVCVLVFALTLAVSCLFVSAKVDTADYGALKILLVSENVWVNLLVSAAGLLLGSLLVRAPVTRRGVRWFSAAMLFALAGLAGAYIVSVNAHAESDGDVLLQIAQLLASGDTAEISQSGAYFHYYLVRFPYQCGLLSIYELLVRVVGATPALAVARLLNLGLLLSAYAALLMTTQRLFHDEHVTLLTAVFMCLCLQPMLSTTFVYGLIPALALSIWALYFVVRYLQTARKRNILPAAVLLMLAVYLRSNTWIVIAAVIIVLVIQAIRTRKFAPVLLGLLIVELALPLPKLAQQYYETRLDTSFGAGYPKSYWMAMSLQDGQKATGWHVSDYQVEMEQTYGEDVAAIDTRAKEDIRAGIARLVNPPSRLCVYLFDKLVSQWNEPTFLSIWITKSVKAYEEPGALAKAVYNDQTEAAFRQAEGYVLRVLYAALCIGAFALLRRREPERLLLPLVVLGGALFHLFFEAKSQYVVEYLPLIWPVAAFGIVSLGRWLWKAPARLQAPRQEEQP